MSMAFEQWNITQATNAGESAFVFYFSGENLSEQNGKVRQFANALVNNKPNWVIEIVPSFDSVMVCFNSLAIDQYSLFDFINRLSPSDVSETVGIHHCINVHYDRNNQYDLEQAATTLNMSPNDVVFAHTARHYTAYAVGFSPGFAYLGEINDAIQIPRLKTPRTKVPKGAVAIADSYTAVYPDESPGGWHLIGIIAEDQPSMLERDIKVGDTVAFVDYNCD